MNFGGIPLYHTTKQHLTNLAPDCLSPPALFLPYHETPDVAAG